MNQEQLEFKVTEEIGQRIDLYLSLKLQGFSRSRISKLIEQGKIKVNRQKTNKSYRLKEGDHIVIAETETEPSLDLKPQKLDIKVIYEDNYLLVISKPAGMVCHPGPGHSSHTLVNALLYHCSRLSNLSQNQRPGLVHRLDKDTSGLIIIAKDDSTYEHLSELFKKREVKKSYIALAMGLFAEKRGRIELPVSRSRRDRKKISVSVNRGRDAVTLFSVLEEYDSICSLLQIGLQTGRTHQIRVHLSYIGHPVVGDRQYGTKECLKLADKIGLNRQFLHAKKLKFIHPVTRKTVEVEDRFPDDLSLSLEKLNKLYKK
ncbi:MAG: RluA family pseudouridine synthase [Actinomycetota bacterium]